MELYFSMMVADAWIYVTTREMRESKTATWIRASKQANDRWNCAIGRAEEMVSEYV